MPVVAANIDCDGLPSLRGHRVIERSGWRIGVLGVAAGAPEGCEEKDVRTAVLGELEVMPPVDVRVMLWPEDMTKYGPFAEDFTELDIVIGGRGGQPRPHPVRNGNSWFVLPHMRSKQLSILELSKSKGAQRWARATGR